MNKHQQVAWILAGMLVCICGGADWRQFRGPGGRGVSTETNLPTKWSEKENIAWKAALPGRGLSGPIVIGDRVVVTASSGYRQDRLHVFCFDAKTGKQRWHRRFWSTGRTMTHGKICPAAPTPVSDGKQIFATFSTNDVVCLDLEGNLKWLRGLTHDYPNASNSLGMASSPVVVGDTFVYQLENDSQSLAVGLNVETGKNRWLIDRPKKASWTSPVVLPGGDGEEEVLVLQSGSGLHAYNPTSGGPLGKFEKGCSAIPSSTLGGNLIIARANGLTALQPVSIGSEPETVWQNNRLAPATASPLVYQDHVYTVNNVGVVKCASLKDGELVWQLRIKGPF
ncbi:MAG: PQQ-binding-like beta-propeller repeat protein, partial [Planctomycetaceae bacterium]|nr:PQQ-binding-like beta-propeller repeat protein [Planctomycetaceae bacterium]